MCRLAPASKAIRCICGGVAGEKTSERDNESKEEKTMTPREARILQEDTQPSHSQPKGHTA
jgi:hypothetical protein